MERRRAPRFDIQSVDFATIRTKDGYMLYGTVDNIGTNGVSINLFPHSPGAAPQKGDEISFEIPPQTLKEALSEKKGKIVWTKGQEYGIHLASPVAESGSELKKFLKKLNNFLKADLLSAK